MAHTGERNRLQLEWKEKTVAQDLKVMQAQVAAERMIRDMRQQQATIGYPSRPAIGYAQTIYDGD